MPRKYVPIKPKPVLDEDWCFVKEASTILNVHVTAVNDVVVKYDVQYRHVDGYATYFVPELEIAALGVAAMRANRKPRSKQPEVV